MFEIFLSGTTQGLIWAILAIGVFISYRVLDVADLSCEGSITLGASVAALLIWKEVNPYLAVLMSFLAGCVAGAITGVLHTKFKIPPILSGILTMISLYSINIHIMSIATEKQGTANLSLLGTNTVFSSLGNLLKLNKTNSAMIIGVLFCVAIILILYWFFGTELGSAIRATGNNGNMCRAQGIDTDMTKIIGLALSNGLIAVSGSLLGQYQGYSDVNMGVGSIVIGLASIIIGEAIFARSKSFLLTLSGILIGSVLYRLVVAFVIYSGMPSTDLKVMTAVVVVIALALSSSRTYLVNKFQRKSQKGGQKQ